ncbi:MAG TPA: MerC domain-containing protein [Pseudobdellovibrionaceae bacterium]
MNPITTHETKKWDRTGVLLSALCALHCLVAPFIAYSLPLWIYSIHYSPFHLFISIFIVPVAIYSFWTGYKKHKNKMVLFLGGLGIFLLSVALIGPSNRHQLRWNDIMTIIGSIFLIAGHLLNRVWNRRSL